MKSKSIPARVGAALAALATLGALWVPGTARKATAETPETKPRPYVAATILSHEDGTGFGTPAAPWLTEENGFPVGDEGPHDGVVTTGDTVHYRVRLAFQAAKARDVTVFVAGSKYLTEAAGNTCPSGVNVTGRTSGSGCTYSIPAGVAESVDVDLYMTAGDTAGKAVTGIKPELRLARSGGATDSLQLGALTIVSAANADLVVDNGALSGKERYLTVSDMPNQSKLDGYFDLKVRPLRRQGYTTNHGASTTVPWRANMDVTAWPDGTSWIFNGATLSPVGGILKLPEVQGDQRLYFHIPVPTTFTPGKTNVYDIHAILDSSSFNGIGQPGDHAGRDITTYDSATGATNGVPYANNDYSEATLTATTPLDPPGNSPAYHFDLSTPYDANHTLWESGNTNPPYRLEKNLSRLASEAATAVTTVGLGTSLEMSYVPPASNEDRSVELWESFDDGLVMSDVPQVFDRNGNALEPPGIDKYGNGADRPNYEIYYSTTPHTHLHDKPCSVSDETCMAIAPKDMSTIRTVVIRLPHTKYGYRVVWHMKATKAGHHLIDGVGELENEGFVDVQAPGLWTVKADTEDTSAEPYDTVRTTIAPQLADVPSSTLDMTADLNVCASNGLAKTHISGSGWALTPTVEPGCGSAWTAHWTGKSNANRSGDGYLPSLEVIGIVKPTATAAQTVSVNGTVSSKEQGDIKARTQNLVATRAITVTAPAKAASSVDTGMDGENPKLLDPGTEMHGTARLYVHGPQATGPASMVVKLPGDDYSLYNGGKGPDGTWHEYDRGCTTLRDIALAKEPTLDLDLSGQVTLQYTTDTTASLDPSKLTWKDTTAITDWSKVTAILVIATPDKAGGTAAASVDITMSAKTANDGQGNFWTSAPYVDGKALTGTPWPGTAAYKYAQASGILFNDVNGDGKADKTERTLAKGDTEHTGEVYVYHSDENGREGAQLMSKWDASRPESSSLGHYGWRLSYLTSGWWLVKTTIDPTKPNGDGTIGYSTTYYNTTDHLAATTPTTRLIHLGVGQNLTDIDFGIRYDKPQVTVTQSTVRDGCKGDSCKVTVNTTVNNTGTATLPASKAVLHSRSQRDRSDDDMVWNETRFVRIHDRTAIDTDGHVWINDSAGWRYHAGCQGQWCRIDMGGAKIARAARNDEGYIFAIDSDGRFLACTSYCTSKYHSEMSYGSRQPWAWSGNAWVEAFPQGVTRWKNVAVPYYGYNIYKVLLEAQDGSLWYFSSAFNDPPFVRLDTPKGVTFNLDAADGYTWLALPGSDGRLYTYTGTDYISHPLMELADTCLSGKSDTGCLFAWPAPDGGPTAVQEVTMNEENGQLKAIVLDKDGSLWELGTDDSTYPEKFKDWKNITPDGYRVKHILSSTTMTCGPIWFIGQDDKLYRYDHDWGGWSDGFTYGSYGKTVPKHDDSVTPYLPDETFSSMADMNTNYSDWQPVALSSDGRPYFWGRLYNMTISSTDVYDPFDSTPSDHSADATQHISATTPIATTTTDGWTTSDYAMPYDLAPGDEYTLRRTFTVPKDKEATVMAVQSWFDSPDTPYSGIKAHRDANLDKPTLPDPAQLSDYTEYGDLNGNTSCLMGGHQFSGSTSAFEDSCEQTAARIPAASTTPVVGSIAGLAWRDKNRDGRRQENEPLMPFVHVTLRTKDGDTAGRAVTDGNGAYRFDGLTAGEYVAWFTSDSGLTWTTRLNTDPAAADDDSDVSADLADWGSTGTLTVSAKKPDWTHVDAGLADRTESGLPLTGRIGIAAMLAIMLAILGLGVALARRR